VDLGKGKRMRVCSINAPKSFVSRAVQILLELPTILHLEFEARNLSRLINRRGVLLE
jgi:hypothetical protein